MVPLSARVVEVIADLELGSAGALDDPRIVDDRIEQAGRRVVRQTGYGSIDVAQPAGLCLGRQLQHPGVRQGRTLNGEGIWLRDGRQNSLRTAPDRL